MDISVIYHTFVILYENVGNIYMERIGLFIFDWLLDGSYYYLRTFVLINTFEGTRW